MKHRTSKLQKEIIECLMKNHVIYRDDLYNLLSHGRKNIRSFSAALSRTLKTLEKKGTVELKKRRMFGGYRVDKISLKLTIDPIDC